MAALAAVAPKSGSRSRIVPGTTSASEPSEGFAARVDRTTDRMKNVVNLAKATSRMASSGASTTSSTIMYKPKYLLDPRGSKFMPVWDIVMMFALSFTAIVTPYEVVFVDEGPCVTTLFVMNRLVDLCFVLDILIILNLAYQDKRRGGWVVQRREIRKHYLRGWFAIDFLSVILRTTRWCTPTPCTSH